MLLSASPNRPTKSINPVTFRNTISNRYRRHITHQEMPEPVGSTITHIQFLHTVVTLHDPDTEHGNTQTTQRQHDIGRQVIQQIKNRDSSRKSGINDSGLNSDQLLNESMVNRPNPQVATPAYTAACTRVMPVVFHQPGHCWFNQRNSRCPGGKHQQHKKQGSEQTHHPAYDRRQSAGSGKSDPGQPPVPGH